MEFFLTIVICTAINNQCVEVPIQEHDYRRTYKNHYECVNRGLNESLDILYTSKIFTQDEVENMELYPKFWCEKIIIPKEKPEPKPTI